MSNTIYTIGAVPNDPAAGLKSGKPSKSSKIPAGNGWSFKKLLNRKNASLGLLVLLIGVIGSYFWVNRLPSLKAPVKTLVQFEASSRFASLPYQQQQAYYDALRNASWQDRREAMESLSPAQMQQYRTNTDPFNPRAKERDEFAKAFYADHTAAGKRALLVKMMDQWQAHMPTSRPAGPPNGGNSNGNNRPGGRGGNAPGDASTPFREMRQSMSEIRMENGLPSHR
jgi:hypothetical protein